MASARHQIRPVAHLPLGLGGFASATWQRLSIPSALRTPPMSSRVAVGARRCSWRCWMAIRPSLRAEHVGRNVGYSPSSHLAGRAPRSRMTGWRAEPRCAVCGASAPALGGDRPNALMSMPSRPPGCPRIRRPSPSRGPMRGSPTGVRGQSHLVLRRGPAKMARMSASQGSCVSACAVRASHSASACALAIPVPARSPRGH